MSGMYGLRITCDEMDQKHLGYLKDNGLTLAVHEVGSETNKGHFHFAIVPKNLKTVKQYIMRAYPGGNEVKAWTRQIKDVSKYLRYMCKGEERGKFKENELIYNLGIDVNQMNQEYWDEHDFLISCEAEKKRSRTPFKSCFEDIKDSINLQNLRPYEVNVYICKKILSWHFDKKLKIPTRLDMERWVQTYRLWIESEPEDHNLELAIDRLIDEYYRM